MSERHATDNENPQISQITQILNFFCEICVICGLFSKEGDNEIQRADLVYIPLGVQFGKVTGMIFFADDIILCVQEFLNFELQVIEGYGYIDSDQPNPTAWANFRSAAR